MRPEDVNALRGIERSAHELTEQAYELEYLSHEARTDTETCAPSERFDALFEQLKRLSCEIPKDTVFHSALEIPQRQIVVGENNDLYELSFGIIDTPDFQVINALWQYRGSNGLKAGIECAAYRHTEFMYRRMLMNLDTLTAERLATLGNLELSFAAYQAACSAA